MKVQQDFTVAKPRDEVWAFLHDVPAVADCMTGAELIGESAGDAAQSGALGGDGSYDGKVSIRLGPFSANFEGKAEVSFDETTHSGHVDGRGVDKRGGSRSKLALDFKLIEIPQGTRVELDADIQLSGAIAQFGRTGLIHETSKILIGDFSRELEARLGGNEAAKAETVSSARDPAAKPVGGLNLAWRGFIAWIKSLVRQA